MVLNAVSTGISAASGTLSNVASPVANTVYYSSPNASITTTEVNQAVYVYAGMIVDIFVSSSSTDWYPLIHFYLYRFDGSTYTQLADQIWIVGAANGQTEVGQQQVWPGVLDTVTTPGSYYYVVAASYYKYSGTFTVSQLSFDNRSILVQTLKR
jgi:hypothetical protein